MPRGGEEKNNAAQLSAAKRSYRNAAAEGNRQEEARWANVVGDILKNRGEYVEALKWLRVDYDVSVKYLPEKQLLPTCQSLGEIYLRLESFKDALIYQKKHLELAKDSNDLVEQQRASTQLGRTYHEMFLRSDVDHYAVRNAKKYFKSAMSLAQSLKQNPPADKSSFLKEYIDAHNNIGMLEMDLDNLEEAERILMEGLRICDEEEVAENDDGRTRIHHNLGKVYMDLRKWDKARENIEKDIMICKSIGHCQGEAKGYINLGEWHYRVQKCEEAIRCYENALKLAKSMEDEDALAEQISQNIETVKEAMKVFDEMKIEEQNLKKLVRNMPKVIDTERERKCLLQQNASLDRLIEKSSLIFAWMKHRHYAKEKKRVAGELRDKEKLSDAFLAIGESYQKLRNFKKALKWYTKSWETYKTIGSLEGQALAKINIGGILDSEGDWLGALSEFEEGYRIALQANLLSSQLSALENMHYSHMIRFDNVEEARRLHLLIDKLKFSKSREYEAHNANEDCCSETETEEDEVQPNESDMCCSYNTSKPNIPESQPETPAEDDEDLPIISLIYARKKTSKPRAPPAPLTSTKPSQDLPEKVRPTCSQQTLSGRKRVRVILSDDEGEVDDEARSTRTKVHEVFREDIATSDEFKSRDNLDGAARDFQDVSGSASKSATRNCNPINLEESICSYKARSPEVGARDAKYFQASSTGGAVENICFNVNDAKCSTDGSRSHSKNRVSVGLIKHACHDEHDCILFKIDESFVHVRLESCMLGGKLSVACMKVEVACLYYLQLPAEKRSRGLLPIIQHLSCGGRALDTLEEVDNLKDHLCGKGWVEVFIDGWVQNRLMKLYIDFCIELSESPSLKVLKKLYNLEVSEDELIVSDCELQDVMITPLLNALEVHQTFAVLDLSHNLLGNGTVEKLQKVLTSSSQRYGGLLLDLHCNCLGPTSLLQICECPVLFTRLEVLNVSGNRLTDQCGSCLSFILENCKALYSLNIERCSITSRTIQKVADSLRSDSVLSHISLGYNNPVSANTLISLLKKLSTLKRFSELNVCGLKLSMPVVNSLCQLMKASGLSTLMLGNTKLGLDGALQLTQSISDVNQELAKLDFSSCGLTSQYIVSLNAQISLISGLVELNLGGNPIMQEGANLMVSLLKNPQCCLRIIDLSNCQLGIVGVLQILQALLDNCSIEELNLAKNGNIDILHYAKLCDLTECPKSTQADKNSSSKVILPEEVEAAQQGSFAAKIDVNELEVADSEDELMKEDPAVSSHSDGCVSSSQRNNISSQQSQLVQELSAAIGMVKNLQFLDLSDNGFTEQNVEALYTAWSLCSRADTPKRHIEKKIIHFMVQGHKCCEVKPCCRKD